MSERTEPTCIAFAGETCIATGATCDVATALRRALDHDPHAIVLAFDAETGALVELDLRGSEEDVRARYMPAPPEPRSPGRPKLGVVAREVTLLPRHWEWLATQPGSASVTLRKLVEAARHDASGNDRRRRAQEATYRFAVAMAGDEPGFEEATRALYAGEAERFSAMTEAWPPDIRDQVRRMAEGAFGDVE